MEEMFGPALLFLKHVGHPSLSRRIASWTPILRVAILGPPAGRVLSLLLSCLFEAARDRRAEDALLDSVPEGLEMYRTAADDLIDQGIEKGLEQGRILEARFGAVTDDRLAPLDRIVGPDRIDA